MGHQQKSMHKKIPDADCYLFEAYFERECPLRSIKVERGREKTTPDRAQQDFLSASRHADKQPSVLINLSRLNRISVRSVTGSRVSSGTKIPRVSPAKCWLPSTSACQCKEGD